MILSQQIPKAKQKDKRKMTDLNKGFTSPMLPEDIPFSDDQKKWLGGFMAGLHSRLQITQPTGGVTTAEVIEKPITIIYGSQTGNAEGAAYDAADVAKAQGLAPIVLDMDDVTLADLPNVERLLVVTSTYGEGEMPDNAAALWQEIASDDAPKFANTFFSVLGLGDTGYDDFCECAIQWDERLAELGATRIADRVDCDVDYDDDAAAWTEQAISVIKDKGTAGGSAPVANATPKKEKSKYNRKNPLLAPLISKRRLTSENSSKEIMHFEFSLGDSGESYEAGDAINIIPRNQPALVAEIMVFFDTSDQAIQKQLTDELEIRIPTKEFVKAIAEKSADTKLTELVNGQAADLSAFIYGKDCVDMLKAYPTANFTLEEFMAFLKPIAARAYSIASSINAHPAEVQLTIGSVRYNQDGRDHNGVCSTFLADIANEGEGIQCYFSPAKAFSVPEDNSTNIIMVGPGTGIAPFRGFLEEREVRNASGKNWLFFGDRTIENDFIYREEMEALQEKGMLKLDLAFSRDQAEKIYVQDRIKEKGAEFYQWLEDGAHFYICGDAFRMAKDVDKAILEVIATHGNKTADEAEAYVRKLKKEKRYARDVY